MCLLETDRTGQGEAKEPHEVPIALAAACAAAASRRTRYGSLCSHHVSPFHPAAILLAYWNDLLNRFFIWEAYCGALRNLIFLRWEERSLPTQTILSLLGSCKISFLSAWQ